MEIFVGERDMGINPLEKKSGMRYNESMTEMTEVGQKIVNLLREDADDKEAAPERMLKALDKMEIGKLENKFESIYTFTLLEYAVDTDSLDLVPRLISFAVHSGEM